MANKQRKLMIVTKYVTAYSYYIATCVCQIWPTPNKNCIVYVLQTHTHTRMLDGDGIGRICRTKSTKKQI